MAMYENLGFCPANSLGFLAPNARQLLEDRIGYLVYANGCVAPNESYIVDIFKDEPKLAIHLADLLKTFIPECKYAEVGKKILLSDINGKIKYFEADGIIVVGEHFSAQVFNEDSDTVVVNIYKDPKWVRPDYADFADIKNPTKEEAIAYVKEFCPEFNTVCFAEFLLKLTAFIDSQQDVTVKDITDFLYEEFSKMPQPKNELKSYQTTIGKSIATAKKHKNLQMSPYLKAKISSDEY